MMKRYLVFMLIFLMYGCAQRLKTPLFRGISPEVRGVGHKFSLNKSAILESKLKLDSSFDLDSSLSSDVEYINEYKMDFAFGRQFEFFTSLANEVGLMFGFKVQIWGLPFNEKNIGHKFSFAFNTGGSADEFTQDGLDLDLESSVVDFYLIHGFRFSENWLIYESFSVSEYKLEGEIANPPITFSSRDFIYKSSNTHTLAVGLIGSYQQFEALLELTYQRYRWDGSNYESSTAISYGAGYTF